METRPCARRLLAAAGVSLIVTLGGASSGRAEMWNNPALPRSPYVLPEPTYHGPDADVDELINGNGKLHFSGQWRHWGDSRNSGELVYDLLAPRAADPAEGGLYRPRGVCPNRPGEC